MKKLNLLVCLTIVLAGSQLFAQVVEVEPIKCDQIVDAALGDLGTFAAPQSTKEFFTNEDLKASIESLSEPSSVQIKFKAIGSSKLFGKVLAYEGKVESYYNDVDGLTAQEKANNKKNVLSGAKQPPVNLKKDHKEYKENVAKLEKKEGRPLQQIRHQADTNTNLQATKDRYKAFVKDLKNPTAPLFDKGTYYHFTNAEKTKTVKKVGTTETELIFPAVKSGSEMLEALLDGQIFHTIVLNENGAGCKYSEIRKTKFNEMSGVVETQAIRLVPPSAELEALGIKEGEATFPKDFDEKSFAKIEQAFRNKRVYSNATGVPVERKDRRPSPK